LGIAGTGGTSSSSSGPAELWTFLAGFGVGNRDPANAAFRGCSVVFPTLKELRLEFEEMEIPEAYDFRFGFWSGVALADDGVTLFLKIIAGD
jgi:hypothetical protein